MIEVQKKLKDDPAQRSLPCILCGGRSKTVFLFVTPTSGIVLSQGVTNNYKAGQLVNDLIPYNHSDWTLDPYQYTLTNQDL